MKFYILSQQADSQTIRFLVEFFAMYCLLDLKFFLCPAEEITTF